jgi:hypothetical protein
MIRDEDKSSGISDFNSIFGAKPYARRPLSSNLATKPRSELVQPPQMRLSGALLRRDGIEGGPALLDFLAATVGA